jgi:antitoxin component YwqK of YwqJK toxin-antitoxin module
MEYYGIMAISNFSANVFYDEKGVVTKLHIHFVASEIDTIVIPIYDENGVLIGSEIKTNTKSGTLNFKYNDKGQRIYAETYDVWYHTFSARTYVYNEQGKLLEKHACESRSELPESFDGMEMKLVHKYHYDENGKLQGASPVEYSNDKITYEVDSKGRIIKVTSKSDTSVGVKEFTYEDCYIYTPVQ